MTNPLSDAEANKLFNSVSENLGNPNKLNEILEASFSEKPETPAQPEPEPEVPETKEVEPEVPASQEPTPTDEGVKVEEPTPANGTPAPTPELKGEDEVEALRQKLRLMEHRLKSDDGRVAAFQRQYEAVKAELAELKKNAKPPSAATAPESSETDEDLEMLKKADPALYRVLMKREEKLRHENESLRAELKQELAPVKQTFEHTQKAAEVDRLKQMVPNITEVVQSEAFSTYRDHVAPPVVRELLKSRSADDVVQGLQVYAAWAQANILSAKAEPVPPQDTSTPAAPSLAGNAVQAERERKLATSVNVGSPSTIPSKKEMTADELFEQHFSQTLKRNEIKR